MLSNAFKDEENEILSHIANLQCDADDIEQISRLLQKQEYFSIAALLHYANALRIILQNDKNELKIKRKKNDK